MNWKVLLASFVLVFVAELGDKTQLTALAFSASSRSPWSVFLGTALALVTAAGLAVLFGGLLGRFVPEKALHIGSAVLFVLIGLALLVNVARKAPAPQRAEPAAAEPLAPAAADAPAASLPTSRGLVLGLVLSQAREFEDEAARFFGDLAGRATDPAVQRALAALAEEERHHADALADLAGRREMSEAGAAVDSSLPAGEAAPLLRHALAPPRLAGAAPAGDPASPAAVLPGALQAAVKAEEQAAEFYLALARLSSLPAARDAFRRLAAEEIRHAQRLCDLAAGRPDATA
jgi:rubrerythrin